MTTRRIVVTIDYATLNLVVDALKADASRRQRAAMRAAGELEADVAAGEVSDRRPAAVRITKVLAEAAALVAFADELEAAPAAPATDMPAPPADDEPDDVDETAAKLLTTPPPGYRSVLDDDDVVDPQEVLR